MSRPDKETVDFVREIRTWTVPELPFEYAVLDHAFEENLRSTTRTMDLFKFIAIIAVFIACLGLFALASYTVEKKPKRSVSEKYSVPPSRK